ncbi:hypothetical protein [Mucilaginibacter sp. UYCu711]|uniref:hypothetical protein n=1 Tax=Mucilaginibacter sp. UYCu711 TaxID=3156339 RepID=UPI003D1B873A
MKHNLLTILLLICIGNVNAQNKDLTENAIITSNETEMRVYTADGVLHVNISPKDVTGFKAAGYVRYSSLGAKGDGKTDDMDAIAATHVIANRYGLKVKADDNATYYIGGKARTAIILTDTDWGKATFILDDTEVQNRNASVFMVGSTLRPFKLQGVGSLKKGQKKISAALPGPCLVTVVNSAVKQYIRFGLNQNNGSSQTDIVAVDKDGNIDRNAPVIWDFDHITDITALPIDEKVLNITGGRFITIANKDESKYNYYARNIAIKRSNVVVDGIEHRTRGEEDHGAPYGGFIHISDCAYVTVKNTVLTGHRTYTTIGTAGKPVQMGTYELTVDRAINVSFINCTQTNSIDDATYWGVLGSNFSKNLLYDHCILSRFDAHQGVANATIRNSTLGHMGINAIGCGTLLIENSTVRARSFVNLRSDYGSAWQGNVIIRNCVFVPAGGKPAVATLIGGSNSGQHDFGYVCYMPENIMVDNLRIDDSAHPDKYNGPAIFANFNPDMKDASYQEKFPYVITKQVTLKNVTTTSGKTLRVSDNLFEFKDVTVAVKN